MQTCLGYMLLRQSNDHMQWWITHESAICHPMDLLFMKPLLMYARQLDNRQPVHQSDQRQPSTFFCDKMGISVFACLSAACSTNGLWCVQEELRQDALPWQKPAGFVDAYFRQGTLTNPSDTDEYERRVRILST